MSTNLPYVTECALLNLPYSNEYLALLNNINSGDVTFDNIKNPLMPTDEHSA